MARADLTDPGSGVERVVVLRGAAAALLLSMSAALANVLLASQDPKPHGALNATFVVLLLGFVLGGFVAGLEAPRLADRHGAWAGLVAFVPVEVVGILGRLDRGEPVSLFGIVIVGFLAAGAGLAGSRLGARRRARTHPGGDA